MAIWGQVEVLVGGGYICGLQDATDTPTPDKSILARWPKPQNKRETIISGEPSKAQQVDDPPEREGVANRFHEENPALWHTARVSCHAYIPTSTYTARHSGCSATGECWAKAPTQGGRIQSLTVHAANPNSNLIICFTTKGHIICSDHRQFCCMMDPRPNSSFGT